MNNVKPWILYWIKNSNKPEPTPPTPTGTDWTELGYSGEPQAFSDDFAYSKSIYDNWTPASNLSYKFAENRDLVFMPLVDTSSATKLSNMFDGCFALRYVPLLDTSNVVNISSMFYSCTALKEIPIFDTSNVTAMKDFVKSCHSLSGTSLNNIMQMCINATNFTGTKTLKNIGLSSTQATTCQSLSNYDDLSSAGWTTGY